MSKQKLESEFQTDVMNQIREMFPGCIILKNDANYTQGIPDWLILWGPHWAVLEVKRDKNSRTRPNQPWYVETMNKMSYAAFIYPENKEEVLNGLQSAFRT